MASKDKLISNAQKFLAKGQLPKAISEYQKLVASFPKDVRNRQKLAELLSREKRIEDALAEYEHVARHYTDTGFYLKAIAVYKQMQKLDPARVEICRKLAELNEKQGLVGNALTEYRNLVTYYEQNGLRSEAVPILEKMLALDPSSLNIRAKLVEIMFATQAEEEAVGFFLELIDNLQQEREFGKIVKLYDRFQEHLSDEAVASLPLAAALLVNNQPEKAVQLLKKLLKTAPEDLQILHKLGDGYMALEDYENARLTYRHLVRLESDNIETWERLTRACLAADEPDKALEAIEEGKEHFVAAQRFEPLQDLFEEILRKRPDSSRAADGLAEIREASAPFAESSSDTDTRSVEETSPQETSATEEPAAELNDGPAFVSEDSASGADETATAFPKAKDVSLSEVDDSAPDLELDLDLDLDLGTAGGETSSAADSEADQVSSETAAEDFEADSGSAATLPQDQDDAELEIELEIDLDDLDALGDLDGDATATGQQEQSGQDDVADDEESRLSAATATPGAEAFVGSDGKPCGPAEETHIRDAEEHVEIIEETHEPEESETAELPAQAPEEDQDSGRVAPASEADFEEPPESAAFDEDFADEAASEVEAAEGAHGEESEEPEELEELEEIVDLEEEPEELEEIVEAAEAEDLEELDEVVETEEPELLEDVEVLEEETASPALAEAQPEAEQSSAGGLEAELEDAAFYARQGLFDDAERVLRSAIDKHGELPELVAKLADLDENRQTSAADDDSMDFSDLISELNEEELLGAADSLGSESQTGATQSEWTQELATELDSEDTESHYNLGIAYKEMGLYEDAVAEFNKASRDLARQADCLTLKAQCFLEMGERETAEQTLRQGLALEGLSQDERITLQYELGLFYRTVGRFLEALESFQEVADYDLFFRDVGEIVKSLRQELKLDDEPDDEDSSRRNRDRISFI